MSRICTQKKTTKYVCPTHQAIDNAVLFFLENNFEEFFKEEGSSFIRHVRHKTKKACAITFMTTQFNLFNCKDNGGYDLVVCEELSMWSTEQLLGVVIYALKGQCIMMGDDKQLPPVLSASFPLLDITASNNCQQPLVHTHRLVVNRRTSKLDMVLFFDELRHKRFKIKDTENVSFIKIDTKDKLVKQKNESDECKTERESKTKIFLFEKLKTEIKAIMNKNDSSWKNPVDATGRVNKNWCQILSKSNDHRIILNWVCQTLNGTIEKGYENYVNDKYIKGMNLLFKGDPVRFLDNENIDGHFAFNGKFGVVVKVEIVNKKNRNEDKTDVLFNGFTKSTTLSKLQPA